jgi:hypothetical protein
MASLVAGMTAVGERTATKLLTCAMFGIVNYSATISGSRSASLALALARMPTWQIGTALSFARICIAFHILMATILDRMTTSWTGSLDFNLALD